jgi:hypothetical protein
MMKRRNKAEQSKYQVSDLFSKSLEQVMEQSGTKRGGVNPGEKQRVSPFFSSSADGVRQRGNSSPHNPPKGGCVGEERHSPMPTPADAAAKALAEKVKECLPTCAAVAAEFRAAFPGTRMVFAEENGHTLGKRGPDGIKLSETLVGSMTKRKA